MNKELFIRNLFNPKTDKVTLLINVKRLDGFEKAYSFLKEATRHPVIKKWLFATPYPKDYQEIRRDAFVANSNNIEGEIAWNLISILSEKDKINEFLKKKTDYENYVLLGQYEDGINTLSEIQASFGVSIWLIENLLLISELRKGTEENWIMLSDFAEKINDGLVSFFTQYLSKRVEEKVSYYRYRDVLYNEIKDIEASNAFKEFIIYRLNYISIKEYSNHPYFLSLESVSSIIDRYLLLRQILTEKFNPINSEFYKKVIRKTKEINDSLLKQIQNCLSTEDYFIFNETKSTIEIIDLYSLGSYKECLESIKVFLLKHPQTIELYDIYVKSLIELKIDFVPSKISPLIDNILLSLYKIYQKDSQANKAYEDLLKIITSNFSSDWAKQLYALTATSYQLENKFEVINNFYHLFSKFNNPKRLDEYIPDSHNINLEKFKEHKLNSPSLDILNAVRAGNEDYFLDSSLVPDGKRKYYLLKVKYKKQEFEDVVNICQEITSDKSSSQYVFEEAAVVQFKSYLKLNLIQKALQLYVDVYLINPNLTKRMNQDDLLSKIQIDTSSSSLLIEYPIFFTICFEDPYERYIAYDSFMSLLNYEKPSELIADKNKFGIDKLIYFLRYVCEFEVLKHSYYFSSREEIESERLLLLDELLKIDKKNETIYIKEVTKLTQDAEIKRALKEVNKGRITINVDPLIEAESNNLKEGFSRYIELAKFSKSRNAQAIDINAKQLSQYFNQINEELKNKIIYTNDPAFISFKLMFLEMRDKFLLSKEYGLDGYLSTRIRHGAFQNYIRSVFESEKLISQKDSNGKYLDLEYWTTKISPFYSDKTKKLTELFQIFSKKIDEYTEFVIKELIQVKTEKYEKKPNALFDYSLDQYELAAIFKIVRETIKDHRTFIDLVFSFLIEKTEEILKKIKQYFSVEITNGYLKIIEDFQDDAKLVIGTSLPELNSAIMRCGTLLRKEIANISEWFNIANPTSSLIMDLNTILQTSIQITNRIYPYRKIYPEIDLNVSRKFKGSLNLIYIIRILLDNIIQHSLLNADELKIKIEAKDTDDDFLYLVFTNNLSSIVDKKRLTHILEEIKEKWQQREQDYTKSDIEGGSGFDKIRRILTFDMRNKSHDFDFNLSDENISISLKFKFAVIHE